MRGRFPTGRVGWDRAAVLGTGGLEVVVRVLSETAARGLETGIGAVLASTAVNLGVRSPVVLTATQTAFLVTAFYLFSPRLMPGSAGERADEDRSYRLLLALGSGAFALPVVMLATGLWTELGWAGAAFRWYLLGAVIALLAVMGSYLAATQSERVIDPEGSATAVFEARGSFDPDAFAAQLRYMDGWSAPVRRAVLALASVGVVASHVVPLLLFGLVGGALNAVFPVMEMMVLTGLVADTDRSRIAGLRRVVPGEVPDVEAVVYRRLTLATKGWTGSAAMTAATVGILTPVAGFVVVAGAGGLDPGFVAWSWDIARDFTWRWLTGTVRAGTAGAYVIDAAVHTANLLAIPTAAAYTAWFWYRETQRLPAAVARLGLESIDITRPIPARPPGMVLPAVAIALAWRVELVGGLPTVGPFHAPAVTDGLLLVVYVVGTLVAAWTVRSVRRRDRTGDPQPVAREGRVILVATVGAAFVGLVAIEPVGRALELALTGGVVIWLGYYYEPVEAWAEARGLRVTRVVVAYSLLFPGFLFPLVAAGVTAPGTALSVVIPPLVLLYRVLETRLPDGEDGDTRRE